MDARSLFAGADGRPRALWRLVLFLVLSSFCVFVAVVVLKPVLGSLEQFVGLEGTVESYATVIALLAAHFITFRTYDRRPWSFVWLHREAARPRQLVVGTLLGALPIALTSLALVAGGWLSIQGAEDGSSLRMGLQTLLLLLPAAFGEELLSRGYLFATLREWLGQRTAVVATSVGFGLLHVWNPDVSVMSIVLVTLAGLYLAVVLLATQSLYAAWVSHFAWNWVMAALLHVPVSGIPMNPPDYIIADTGPDWATGGRWGPEGGALAGLGMLAGMGFLYWQRSRLSALGSGLKAHPTEPKAQSTEPTALTSHDTG
ncbi:MAG: lysostaphin resistance A-like protein [Gemmatimonadaceae bacterium]